MTPKESIIALMQYKDERVMQKTNMHLLSDADWEELYSWTDQTHAHIHRCMINEISNHNINDAVLCPWCVLHGTRPDMIPTDISCEKCGFGDRNGVCSSMEDSLYDRITAIAGSITEILDLEEVATYLNMTQSEES